MGILCNHCKITIPRNELRDSNSAIFPISLGRADRVLNCPKCRGDIYFNSQTLEVVLCENELKRLQQFRVDRI